MARRTGSHSYRLVTQVVNANCKYQSNYKAYRTFWAVFVMWLNSWIVLNSAAAMGKFITIITLPPTSVTDCPLRLWIFHQDEVYVVWRMCRPYKQTDLVNKPCYQPSKNNTQKTRKTGSRRNFFFITFTLFRAAGREKHTHTQNELLKSCGRIILFYFPHSCVIVSTAIFEAAASGYQPESLRFFISLRSFQQLNLEPEDQGGKRYMKCRQLYSRPHFQFKVKVFLIMAK